MGRLQTHNCPILVLDEVSYWTNEYIREGGLGGVVVAGNAIVLDVVTATYRGLRRGGRGARGVVQGGRDGLKGLKTWVQGGQGTEQGVVLNAVKLLLQP